MDPSWVYSLIITNSQRTSPNLSIQISEPRRMAVFPQRSCVTKTHRIPQSNGLISCSGDSRRALWCTQAELEFIRLFGWGTRNPKWMVELKVNSMDFPLKATNVSIFQATHWKQASVSDVFDIGVWHCLFQGHRDFSIKSFIPCTWSVPSDTPAVD